MAQIDIGKLTFTHKGDYAGGTAYSERDVVYYNGSAYVAKTSTTGNLPTSTAHWNLFVLKGTDTSVLTTQGDVLYHDGSSLARLGAGTSGYYLKTQGAGANPTWSEVAAGGSHTKIAEFTSSGTPTHFALDNIFTSTYDFYMVYLTNYLNNANNLQWYMRLRTGGSSGANDTNSNYRGMVYYTRRDSGTETNAADGFWDTDHYRIANFDLSDDTNKGSFVKLYIANPYNSDRMTSFIHEGLINHSDMTSVAYTNGACIFNANTSHTGISFSAQDSANKVGNGNKAFVYGIKY